MKVKFYGTRGSTPVSDKSFVEFGGNTSCILVTLEDNAKIIFDAGTGIRQLGNDLLKEENLKQLTIVLSHFHWDHIQGFPFFTPAYSKDFEIMIAICGKDRVFDDLISVFSVQMQSEYFPVTKCCSPS